MPRDPDAKLDRVVIERLMEGRLVPFLGAGVSMEARIPGNSRYRPSLDFWTRRLIRKLERHLGEESLPYVSRLLRDAQDAAQETTRKTASLRDYFTPLAEVAVWLCGQEALCRVLRIDLLGELAPLPAHHYLAWLAREGLVREIISTNYDCCIEKAMAASFGKGGSNPASGQIRVVWDLDSYRHGAGSRRNPEDRPILRLYKINGCASALAEGEAPAEHIILTERQLQQFGPRQWARDLLADRARRLGLLFCGFGAEEPQVRRTAMNIMAEFAEDGGSGRRNTAEEVACLPNAPFVTVHGDDPSFPQIQILAGFYRAHLKLPHGSKRLPAAALKESLLTGAQTGDLGIEGDRLDADAFFALLYRKAMVRLIRHHLRRDGYFRQWIGHLVENRSGPWAKQIDAFGSHLNGPLGFDHEEHPPLVRWLWCIRHPGDAGVPGYTSIRDDPLFFLTTLLALSLFKAMDDPTPPEYRCTPYGLRLKVKDRFIHLIRAGLDPSATGDAPPGKRSLFFIALPVLRETPQEGRWQVTRGKRLCMGRYHALSLEELIADAGSPKPKLTLQWLRGAYARMTPRRRRVRLRRISP